MAERRMGRVVVASRRPDPELGLLGGGQTGTRGPILDLPVQRVVDEGGGGGELTAGDVRRDAAHDVSIVVEAVAPGASIGDSFQASTRPVVRKTRDAILWIHDFAHAAQAVVAIY